MKKQSRNKLKAKDTLANLLPTAGPVHYYGNVVIPDVFFIYEEIGEASLYVDMIQTLDYAGPGNEVNIRLCSPGGNLDSAIAIIHAIQRCQAKVIAHADGPLASAATMIFLACDEFMISPYSNFMFHDASEGSLGKVNENLKSTQATHNLIHKLYHDIYEPYFSAEEVEDILNGKDVYLSSEEMLERIMEAAGEE